ncbi:MAG: hypothetical protein JNL70_14280 [Saprospiraceae bacterium]|nr:hypothetical protein [Saprospiraceae bacterium]
MGVRMKTGSANISKGDNLQAIDVFDLPQGIYYLSIDGTQSKNLTAKFVKM